MHMKTLSRSPKETAIFAVETCKLVIKQKCNGARVVALHGELGAGKTAFAKSFLKTLGIKKRIVSPTFVLLKRYPLNTGQTAYHMDAYRIKNSRECIPLGLKKILKDKNAIILIEWPEQIPRILPKKKTIVRFLHGTRENERQLHVSFPH